MSPQTPKTSARVLAPLSLIACALAVFVILVGSLAGGDSSDGGSTPAPATEQADTSPRTSTERRPPATYTVQEGDTLGAIAEETGVPIETIQLLNPEVDPQALIAGQKLKLRE